MSALLVSETSGSVVRMPMQAQADDGSGPAPGPCVHLECAESCMSNHGVRGLDSLTVDELTRCRPTVRLTTVSVPSGKKRREAEEVEVPHWLNGQINEAGRLNAAYLAESWASRADLEKSAFTVGSVAVAALALASRLLADPVSANVLTGTLLLVLVLLLLVPKEVRRYSMAAGYMKVLSTWEPKEASDEVPAQLAPDVRRQAVHGLSLARLMRL
jgi:hypothetical protein